MTYEDEVLVDHPVQWLKLDETSGTTVVDSSPTGVNGDYLGTVTLNQEKLGSGEAGTSVRLGEVDYNYSTSTGISDPTPGGILVPHDPVHDGLPATIEFVVAMPVGVKDVPDDPAQDGDGSATFVAYGPTRATDANLNFESVVLYGPYLGYGVDNGLVEFIFLDATPTYQVMLAQTPVEDPFLVTVVFDKDAGITTIYVNGEITDDLLIGGITYSPSVSGVNLDFPDGTWPGSTPTSVGGAFSDYLGHFNFQGNHGLRMSSYAQFSGAHTQARIRERFNAWNQTFPKSNLSGSSNARAMLEASVFTFEYGGGAAESASEAVASYEKIGAHYAQAMGSGQSSTSVTRPTRTLEKNAVAPAPVVITAGRGTIDVPADMNLRLFDSKYSRTPSGATVAVYGAWPRARIDFTYDNESTVAWTEYANDDGTLPATTIAIPVRIDKGDHVLHARSHGPGSKPDRTDSAKFTVLHHPAVGMDMGGDTSPIEVPGAVNSDGSRNWVLQDLLPGGLGSWVMPRNPVSSDRPEFTRNLAVAHTTAIGGQNHIFEAAMGVFQWSFAGVTFTKEEQSQLLAYQKLNRRIYIIDHYGRAWKAALLDVQIVPRLRKLAAVAGQPEAVLTDWIADYTCTANVYDRQWYTPVSS